MSHNFIVLSNWEEDHSIIQLSLSVMYTHRAGDELSAPLMRPVDSIDFCRMSGDAINRYGTFLRKDVRLIKFKDLVYNKPACPKVALDSCDY
jgi:hypothetical protein